jgi:hypothetical protein
MKNITVISGDFINSSQYEANLLKSILKQLKAEFTTIEDQLSVDGVHFSIYRGDSFQGVLENSISALSLALQIKAFVNKTISKTANTKSKTPVADIRISIGIGEADYDKSSITESNGEAFHFSGRTLDKMKLEGSKMALTTGNKEINEEFLVSLRFLDAITNRWSTASAEVVYYLLKGYTEQQIANKIGRSQAAINLRKKAAGWEEIQLLLKRYEQVAQKYFV